jgi:hypothetical protein
VRPTKDRTDPPKESNEERQGIELPRRPASPATAAPCCQGDDGGARLRRGSDPRRCGVVLPASDSSVGSDPKSNIAYILRGKKIRGSAVGVYGSRR